MENKSSDPLTCLESAEQAFSNHQGIVNVSLDTSAEALALDFDPLQIHPTEVANLMENNIPQLQQRWQTCTMRLEGHGGRACETCSLRLEKKLQEVPGVQRATASFIGGALAITFDQTLLNTDNLTEKIEHIGAHVAPSSAEILHPDQDMIDQPETVVRFFLTNREGILTLVTFLGMVIGFLSEQFLPGAWFIPVIYTIAYITGGVYGVKNGLESLRARTIDIDLLMVLAAVGAAIVGEAFEGVMLLFLFSLSNVLQDYAIGKTRFAIRSLMKLRPAQATIRRDGRQVVVPIEQVKIGDHMVVRPGERIALDGVILEGNSSVDQASITGESIPVNKGPGDKVISGTMNQQGALEVGVTRLAKDSTIARLIKLVEEAHSKKAKTQRFIDTAEQYYATGVIIATILAVLIPIWFFGEAFNPAFYRAMTLMVAASPCALVISTPATVLSAIGNGARRGVLFKGGVYVEQAASIKAIAFDKTGTLTTGKPELTDIMPFNGLSENELLKIAASVESHSEHPLARAIVIAAESRGIPVRKASQFFAETGKGARAVVDGHMITIGNLKSLDGKPIDNLEWVSSQMDRYHASGKTAILVSSYSLSEANDPNKPATIIGILGIADTLKADAPEVVNRLKSMGIHTIMLTGDHENVAQAIAAQSQVNEYYANLMPEDKVRILKETREKYGPVAMIGDGVNDAPALAAASIGVAMGAVGTDVALETADVVLLADDLHNIPYLITLSQATRRTLITNLGFALFMIAIMIVGIFWISLPLPLAVIGHEGGTVLVSLNGLRMLLFKHQ